MARGQSVIVGGGIAAGSPFTLGSLTRIVNADPPTIANSIIFQRTQAAIEVITVGLQLGTDWPLAATFTERLQVVGGFISDTGAGHGNLIAGQGAAARLVANARNVVLGTAASMAAGGNTTENVLIGFQTAAISADIGSSVLIGARITIGATGPAATTIVGSNNTTNNSFSGPGMGTGCSWQGAGCGFGNQQSTSAVNNWAIVGRSAQANANSVSVLGDNARGSHAFACVFGRNTISLVANSFIAGATGGAQISTVHFGAGDTQVGGQAVTYRHTDGSGTNDVAGDVTIIGPRSTGNVVAGGRLTFQVGRKGASGAALQAATTILSLVGGDLNAAFFGAGSFGTGEGVLFIANALVNPTTNPVGGGILYVNAGALTYRGSAGTTTVLAPA